MKQADSKYDSGLFNLIDDPTLGVDISDEALLSIIRELYYPQSPYTFAVIDAAVLGDIYEVFLGFKIVVTGKTKVSVVEKEEVKASGGVATTPRYVVDQIIKRTLLPKIVGKSPAELDSLSVADIACGSGAFLLQAFQFLMDHHLNLYLADGAAKHNDKVFDCGQNQWRIKLHEKRRILLKHIFGVDIDSQAVEVARFSLLLKLIEGETTESIELHQMRYKEKALPSLDHHIICGNSLVSPEAFNKFMPHAADNLRDKINPLDWKDEFPETGGKFDVVVGNPPYIRIQNMVGYSPEEARFYQDMASGYTCAAADNFDKYALFVERALQLLNSRGRLGYVVPNKFFTLRSGECLRGLIAKGQLLDQIVYFGAHQVFSKSSTYTCILILEKANRKDFTFEAVADLKRWRYGEPGKIQTHTTKGISKKPWSFAPDEAKLLFQRLGERRKTLGEVAEIFVGVQTSADRIYIVKSASETATTITFADTTTKKTWTIEKAILRPSLLDVTLHSFSKPDPNTWIIFPYQIDDDDAVLFTPGEMHRKFPKAWEYLESHKASLKKRNISRERARLGIAMGARRVSRSSTAKS